MGPWFCADPLAQLQLCSSSYHWLGTEITSLANTLTGEQLFVPYCSIAEQCNFCCLRIVCHDQSLPACPGGKVVYLLEGGYNLEALGESVAENFRGVLGLPSEDAFDSSRLHDAPAGKVQRVLDEARRIHQL